MEQYPIHPDRIHLLSIEEQAERRLLPDELSIKDIGVLLYEDKQDRRSFYLDIINACKNGTLQYTGDINECPTDWYFARIEQSVEDLDWPDKIKLRQKGMAEYWRKAEHGDLFDICDPPTCLVHRNNIKEYFETTERWPVTDCLLANWWPEAETTPELDYGEPELPAHDSATLYQVLKILGDDYTHEEFALILLDGDIAAFEKRNETNTLRPITNIKAWLNAHFRAEAFNGEPRHVDLILEQFRYSKPGLSDFKFRALPDHCYMSFTQACERVAKFKGNIEAAEIKLIHGLDCGEIQAHHPLGGRITPEQSSNGMFWKRCYFQKWRLGKWITTEFGEASISDIKNQVDAIPPNDKNGKRNFVAKAWLNTIDPQQLDALTNTQILTKLGEFNRTFKTENGDSFGAGLFTKGGNDWLSRDHSVIPKRKAGAKPGK